MLWQIGLGWSLRNFGLLPFGMHARFITHLVLLKPKHLLILFSQVIHVHGKCKTFGSLDVQCFVLNKKLQDGDSIAKWKSRSWIGVYVGHSLAHAGNVPVIYNLYTTHVSPQFHVVFDDQFTTVSTDPSVLNENFYTTLYDKALWNYNDIMLKLMTCTILTSCGKMRVHHAIIRESEGVKENILPII